MKSILQTWVSTLGLRHQGVLVAMTRGCDGVPKEDVSKLLTRVFRGTFLVSFDPNPSTFIESAHGSQLRVQMARFLKNIDHYPVHFVLHFAHASEIVGYKHPDSETRDTWKWFYNNICRVVHMNPETEDQLDQRLNADEDAFRRNIEPNLGI